MATPGESVVCRGRITGKSEEGGEGLVQGRLTVKGQEDDSLKLKGSFSVALPRRANGK